MEEKIALIARKIAQGGKNIAFTGAGISTESGIPDFRSKGGIWDRFRPVYFNEFMSSKQSRMEYWRQNATLYQDLVRAEPNAAHAALADLYRMGLLESVITQNIDGLHQKAGIPDEKVIELHGNSWRVRCLRCGKISSIHEAQQRIQAGDLAPECACGGYIKPDTISFGQAMPEKQVRQAISLCQSCDFFLVIGSTLLVQPAAMMPVYAKQAKAFTAIINLSETPFDDDCDVRIRAKAGPVMRQICEAVSALRH